MLSGAGVGPERIVTLVMRPSPGTELNRVSFCTPKTPACRQVQSATPELKRPNAPDGSAIAGCAAQSIERFGTTPGRSGLPIATACAAAERGNATARIDTSTNERSGMRNASTSAPAATSRMG